MINKKKSTKFQNKQILQYTPYESYYNWIDHILMFLVKTKEERWDMVKSKNYQQNWFST